MTLQLKLGKLLVEFEIMSKVKKELSCGNAVQAAIQEYMVTS